MKRVIQFNISKEDGYYTAEGVGVPVVTQEKTLDETVANVHEALSLYFEGEDLSELGFAPDPSPFINLELEPIHA
ncbi:MAG: type II toxin-antitoxin system HicB family antitoxin [Candidatus Paceibacterota bacterium]